MRPEIQVRKNDCVYELCLVVSMITEDPCAALREEFEDFRRKSVDEAESIRSDLNDLSTFSRDVTAIPFIKNLVGELLLYVVGEQPKPGYPSARFDYPTNSMKQKIGPRVEATAHILSLDTDNFKSKANNLITSRNNSSHCSSLAELRNRIDNAKKAFKAFPGLIVTMPDEYAIIQAYDEIEAKVLSMPLET